MYLTCVILVLLVTITFRSTYMAQPENLLSASRACHWQQSRHVFFRLSMHLLCTVAFQQKTMATEDVDALCAQLKENNPYLTHVAFHLKNDGRVEKIASALQQNKTLVSMGLFGPRSVDFFLGNQYAADFSCSSNDALLLGAAMLSHPKLSDVCFGSMEFEDFGPIARAFRRNERLTYLEISDIKRPNFDTDLKLLLDSEALRHLSLYGAIWRTEDEPDALMNLAGALGNNRSLKELILDGIHLSEETEQDVARLIRENQNLSKVYLNDILTSNVNIARAIGAAHHHSSLKEFHFSQREDHRYPKMFYDIGTFAKTCKALRTLDLRHCSMKCDELQDLFEGMGGDELMLEKLNLSKIRPRAGPPGLVVHSAAPGWSDSRGTELISGFLGKNPKLSHIEIHYLQIGEADEASLSSLALAMAQNTNLESLDLGDNHIGPVAAAIIAKALTTNSSLKTLDLSGNPLGKEGIASVFENVASNATLERLSVGGWCSGDTEVVVTDRCNDEFNALLEWLPFSSSGLKVLEFCKDQFSSPRMPWGANQDNIDEIANAITKGNTTLEIFDLPKEERVDRTKLDLVLKLNKGGRRILESRNVPDALWPQVLGRSSDSQDVLFFFLRQNPSLVRCKPNSIKSRWTRIVNGALANLPFLFRQSGNGENPLSGRKRKREESGDE